MVPVAGLCDTDSNELLSLTLLQPTKIEACVCAQEEYTNNIELKSLYYIRTSSTHPSLHIAV